MVVPAHKDLNELSRTKRFKRALSLRFVRRNVSPGSSVAVDSAIDNAIDDRARILSRVRELEAKGRLLEAKGIINIDISQNGPNPELIWRLAKIEEAQGNSEAVVRTLTDALTLKPGDPKLTAEYVHALYVEKRYSEARSTILELAPDMRQMPMNRATLGNVYRALGWHAHAVTAYGRLHGLSWRARRSRLASWFRCGAPLPVEASSAWVFESKVEDNWAAKCADRHSALNTLELTPGMDGSQILNALDDSLLQMLTVRFQLGVLTTRRVGRSGLLGFLGLAWFIAFTAIYSVEKHISDLVTILVASFFLAELAALIMATINEVATYFIASGRLRIKFQYIWWLVAYIGLVGLLPLRRISLASFLWLLVVDVAVSSAIWMNPLYDALRSQARLRQQNLRWLLLDGFLSLLYDIAKSGNKSRSSQRAQWISLLEEMALTLERFFPRYLSSSDRVTRTLISERAQAAASSIRMMACSIATPKEGTWERIVSDLRHNVLAIAYGNFGALRPSPSGSPSRIMSKRRLTLMAVLRLTLALVVLGVLIGLLAFPPNQKEIGATIGAIIAGIVTALFALLLKLP